MASAGNLVQQHLNRNSGENCSRQASHATVWTVERVDAPDLVRREWMQLEKDTDVPSATYAWAEAWIATAARARNQKAVILLGREPDGRPAFLLPFVRERRGPFTVLVWPGGTHCAYNAGLFSRSCRERVAQDGAQALWSSAFACLPDVDAIAAYGLPVLEEELDNPLTALPSIDAGCSSHRFGLDDDWETLYHAKCSARLRRNDRRCERRLLELGTARIEVAASPQARAALADTALAQKSNQLAAYGAPDFTQDPGTEAFYRRLSLSPHWREGTDLIVASLDIDERPVAVNLGLVSGDTFHGLIQSMETGGVARFSPGRQLLRSVAEHLCHRGVQWFDLGAGASPDKQVWAGQGGPAPGRPRAFDPARPRVRCRPSLILAREVPDQTLAPAVERVCTLSQVSGVLAPSYRSRSR